MASETVLVTGANGFVALHVIHQCLAKGWRVVGSVRTEKAASRVRNIFPTDSASSQLDLIVVPDMVKPDLFEPAFKRSNAITAVINVASPLINNPEDVRRDVLNPAIDGAIAILDAVSRYADNSVRRVVHTSSCAAVLNPALGDAPGKTYTPDDWNPMTYEQGCASDGGLAYMVSKALAERALWAWMREKMPTSFDLVTIAPSAILGPHYLGALEGKVCLDIMNLNLSSQIIWAIADPTAVRTAFNSYHVGCWVDVRDTAVALVTAVVTPDAGGQRFIAAQRCHWQSIRDSARRVLPELAHRVEPGKPGAAEAAKETTYDIDGKKLTEILGINYTTLDVSLRDAFIQLLEGEKKWKEQDSIA